MNTKFIEVRPVSKNLSNVTIQWVPRAFSLGVKQPGLEADHSSPSITELKECVELYLHSPNMSAWRGA